MNQPPQILWEYQLPKLEETTTKGSRKHHQNRQQEESMGKSVNW
jgi:hypothetical protein